MADPDNYYRLGVANDGQYAIQRVKDGKSTVLTGEPSVLDAKDGTWTRDDALRNTPGPVHGPRRVRREPADAASTATASSPRRVTRRSPGPASGCSSSRSRSRTRPSRSRASRSGRSATGPGSRTRRSPRWDGLLRRAERLEDAVRCSTPPTRVSTGAARPSRVVGRCVFIRPTRPPRGARQYSHILDDSGAMFDTVTGLPELREAHRCPRPVAATDASRRRRRRAAPPSVRSRASTSAAPRRSSGSTTGPASSASPGWRTTTAARGRATAPIGRRSPTRISPRDRDQG